MKIRINYSKCLSAKLKLSMLSLFIFTSCSKDCVEQVWNQDSDTDGEGNPAVTKMACEQPDGYVANSNDPDDSDPNNTSNCTQITYYHDGDGDSYGDANDTLEQCSGVSAPTGFITNSTDCNDNDSTINPGVDDYEYDGIDSDCDGTVESVLTVWNGPDLVFTKSDHSDWTLPENQDQLTANVVLTRQDGAIIYNYQWWQNTFGQDAVVINSGQNDLRANFYNNSEIAVSDFAMIEPSGGTKGVRWGIKDPGLGNYPNTTWENFQFYAEPGNGNFYSLNNLLQIINALESGWQVTSIIDDFTIQTEDDPEPYGTDIVGPDFWIWLIEDDIYLEIKFTQWTAGGEGGGFSYTRSTPDN